MVTSWKKKKAEASRFIKENYSEYLYKEGFLSYQNEGLSWYKVKNGLLYTVHMMSASPFPFRIGFRYGILPLFSWERIALTNPTRDWTWYMDRTEHFVGFDTLWGIAIEKMVLGYLPRPFRHYQSSMTFFQGGVMISHWNTEQCGAEIFDEILFPLFSKIDSIDKLYDYHKTLRLMNISGNGSPSPLISFFTEEEYFERRNPQGNLVDKRLSLTFADECLYFDDKAWFPCVQVFLRNKVPDINRISPKYTPYKTKEGREEVIHMYEHSQKLLQYIESGDRSLLEEALSQNKERMINQIRKKLPDLNLDSLDMIRTPNAEPLRREPFRLDECGPISYCKYRE